MVMHINKTSDSKKMDSIQTTNYLQITNQDGSPRWIWPADLCHPEFLVFYNATTRTQKFFQLVIKVIFFLHLQKVVFKRYKGVIDPSIVNTDTVIFTGTRGPNNKELHFSKDQGRFTKIANGRKALSNVKNEHCALLDLDKSRAQYSFDFPKVISFQNQTLVCNVLKKKAQDLNLGDEHIESLKEIKNTSESQIELHKWASWKTIEERITRLRTSKRISKEVVDHLIKLQSSFNPNNRITCALAHGDFTPWNTFLGKSEKLCIVDWEMSSSNFPIGYDFFHFLFQTGILIKQDKWSEIYSQIHEILSPTNIELVFGEIDVDIDFYLKLYLLEHISYYAALYDTQEDWFEQIHWQMDTWDSALQWATCKSQRPFLIKQFFSNFNSFDYGVLKLGDNDPSRTKVGSDLDILVRKDDLKHYCKYLKDSPIVKQITVKKLSFMSQIGVHLLNGEILHFDLIWQLKRKSKTFLDVSSLIERSYLNPYGVKVVSQADNATYVSAFFQLNHAQVPMKYQDLVSSNPSLEEMDTLVNSHPENRGLKSILNKILYIKDAIHEKFFQRGFIVTFSGVDGAGKTTIIDNIKSSLEKKYRKPVKVLRHRPSILPILSSWKYGKEAAQQRSMERLPRQGNNKSAISSLFRFSYYYLDYLWGQYYIQLKYICRGQIVLYDRYYYDFINDSKRSNITLNPRWIRLGFKFLLVPKFNFFLYASPEVILKRKKELSSDTIRTLTSNYKKLFNGLTVESRRAQFWNIENLHLESTVNTIVSKINHYR